MKILAIDPGCRESAWCEFNPLAATPKLRFIAAGKEKNKDLLRKIHQFGPRLNVVMAVEMIKSYGNVMGDEVIETCVWIGRFIQAWGGEHELLPRKTVVTQICNNPRAKDSNVRAALIDRFGGRGAEKKGGALADVKNDMWSALAVAVAFSELKNQNQNLLERALQ